MWPITRVAKGEILERISHKEFVIIILSNIRYESNLHFYVKTRHNITVYYENQLYGLK